MLVPLCLCNRGTHSSVVQPASNPRTDPGAQEAQPPCPVSTKPVPEEASASAAQPKKLEQLDKQQTIKASSAAQPEEDEQSHQSEISEALSLAIPTSSTPLFKALLEKLADTEDEGIMNALASMFLYGDLKNKAPAVSAAQPDHDPMNPNDLSMRVVGLLQTTKE